MTSLREQYPIHVGGRDIHFISILLYGTYFFKVARIGGQTIHQHRNPNTVEPL